MNPWVALLICIALYVLAAWNFGVGVRKAKNLIAPSNPSKA